MENSYLCDMKKTKRNTLIGISIFGIAYLTYLILLINKRNNEDYITYNSAIFENTVCKIKWWSKTGVEIEGAKCYYFFPETPETYKIMEFCSAPGNPSKEGYGIAIVRKKGYSNKVYFIVDNDTLLVKMKAYK